MKVVIIGLGRGWEDAPNEGECWGITTLILRRPVNRVIDMHPSSLNFQGRTETIKRAAELKALYVNCDNYPLREVIDCFGIDYFSCSLAYAIPHATWEGFTEIDIYGANMIDPDEYSHERPGVEYWIGRAQGAGVKVNVFGRESAIMKTMDKKLYGYGYPQGGVYVG